MKEIISREEFLDSVKELRENSKILPQTVNLKAEFVVLPLEEQVRQLNDIRARIQRLISIVQTAIDTKDNN